MVVIIKNFDPWHSFGFGESKRMICKLVCMNRTRLIFNTFDIGYKLEILHFRVHQKCFIVTDLGSLLGIHNVKM